MALQNPSFSICIHEAPTSVSARPANAGSVTMEFEQNASVTIFTQSEHLSADLAEAIAVVLAKHRQALNPAVLLAAE